MQNRFVRVSTIMLPVFLLSVYSNSYGVAAYMPQSLRECISIICEASGSNSRKSNLEELYSAIRENRMLTSDTIVRKGVQEAITTLQSWNSASNDQKVMIEYLKQYLNNLHDKAILLSMEGNTAQMRSWSAGLVERCMSKESEAYELLRLSNELSDNLCFCGSSRNELDTRVINNMKRSVDQITFKPNVMTSAQSSMPNIILGGTGVNSPVINGWALAPTRAIRTPNPSFPVTMQFVVPDDFERHQPVSVELGFLIPHNGLLDGYANFQVQSKYVESHHSFNPNDVNWTHTNSSGNVKIEESSNPNNVKYMFVTIPLSRSHIKPGYFAILNISRIVPTHGKYEYAGDLALVSSVFKYTSSNNNICSTIDK